MEIFGGRENISGVISPVQTRVRHAFIGHTLIRARREAGEPTACVEIQLSTMVRELR